MSPAPTRLTFQQLKYVTDDLSEKRQIGQGSYGMVYKGERENGEEIAVKVLHNCSVEFVGPQYQNEFHILTKLEHPNIIRLVGYFYETRHEYMSLDGETVFAEDIDRALCFEYMPKGTLQKYLSNECNGLDWNSRYKIIRGACEGLKYLHEELKPPLYHLDIKPDNILLDKNMEPKLADFGLSKFFDEEETHTERNSIGTLGYVPPEHIEEGVVSKKFDIFSLGVVMVKIIAGHEGYFRSADMLRQEFIDEVHQNWRGRLQLISKGSALEAYCQQVKSCTEIALNCMETNRQKRPNIGYIIDELKELDKISPGWTESEMMGVHPRELRFPMETKNRIRSCPLSLINMTDSHVGFVVKKEFYPVKYYCTGSWITVVEPRSTCFVSVSMVGPHEQPTLRMYDKLEMLMITMDKCDLDDLEPLIRSEPDNESKLLLRIQKLGGKVQATTLTDVVFDTKAASETTTKIIPPEQFGCVNSVDIHPTEPWILMAHDGVYVSIWNYQTQAKGIAFELSKVREGCRYHISTAKFIARNQCIVVGDSDGFIHVYTFPTMKLVKKLCTITMGSREGISVSSLAVHPTHPFLLSSSFKGGIKLWDWDNGWSCSRELDVYDRLNQVKFNPKNPDSFAGTFDSGLPTRRVQFWTIKSNYIKTDIGPLYEPRHMDYPCTDDSDRQHIFTDSPGGNAKIWDLKTMSCVHKFILHYSKSTDQSSAIIACHPTLPLSVTASCDGIICFWNSNTYGLAKMVRCTLGVVHYLVFIGLTRLVVGCRDGAEILELDLKNIATQKYKGPIAA